MTLVPHLLRQPVPPACFLFFVSVFFSLFPAFASTHQIVDAESGAPLAKARVVWIRGPVQPGFPGAELSVLVPPDPLAELTPEEYEEVIASEEEFGIRRQCDAKGFVSIPEEVGEAEACILHKRGMVWLKPEDWKKAAEDAPLPVKLLPWPRFEGRVMRDGRPVAGVRILIGRSTRLTGSDQGKKSFTPSLRHIAQTVTDQEGGFSFPRLLPANLEGGRDLPYEVNQKIAWSVTTSSGGNAASKGSSSSSREGGTLFVRSGDLALRPGERATVELPGLPQCVRRITGRLVWADGQPLAPAKDLGKTNGNPFSVYPEWSGVMMSRTGSGVKVQDDGRFSATVPIAGEWTLKLAGQRFRGGDREFAFTLPPAPDGGTEGAPVDLGDILLQRDGVEIPGPAPADAEGNAEVLVRAVSDDGKPLTNVSVTIEKLGIRRRRGGEYHRVIGLKKGEADGEGMILLRVPATHRTLDNNGNPDQLLDVSHAEVKLESPGFEPLITTVPLSAQGQVVVLKRATAGRIRVTRGGQTVSRDRLFLESGRWKGGQPLAYAKWSESEGGLTPAAMPPGTWQVQAAHIADDGWRWFTEVKELGNVSNSDSMVELPLTRGAVLAGRIADEAPRPVKQGVVRVVVLLPGSPASRASRIHWSDWEMLREDGSFEFKGLPLGEAWIAACGDGWISAEPDSSQRPAFLPAGEVVGGTSPSLEWSAWPIELKGDVKDAVIPVMRTGSCILCFKNPDGTPLPRAGAYWAPRLRCGPYLTETLDHAPRSLDVRLRRPFQSADEGAAFLPQFAPRTDLDGELRVPNLPPGPARFGLTLNGRFFQFADPLAMPGKHPLDQEAPFEVMIRSGETVRAEFVVKAQEK